MTWWDSCPRLRLSRTRSREKQPGSQHYKSDGDDAVGVMPDMAKRKILQDGEKRRGGGRNSPAAHCGECPNPNSV